MAEFTEVADRVWVARYEWADANVTAIGGERGLIVVDTHGSTAAGRTVRADLGRLGVGPATHVVNSHWHWDHTFGNGAFREQSPRVPIHAHAETARWLADHGEHAKHDLAVSPDDPHSPEVAATDIVIPDQTFVGARALDLGDRLVELSFHGRGHTSGDIVVRVPDVAVLIAGDLVEESAKPWIGLDSWPLEWPGTLEVLLSSMSETTLVVPGHGVVVDRRFVETQRGELARIAESIRSLVRRGVAAERAPFEGDWPWELGETINNAVIRGYEALAPGFLREA